MGSIYSRKRRVAPTVEMERITAHQIAAAAKPRSSTKSLLGKQRLSANARARMLNDFLADPKAN